MKEKITIFWHSFQGKTILVLLLVIAAGLGLAAREYTESRKNYNGIQIENSEAVAEKIRTGLAHRAWKLHITFRSHTDDEERIKSLVDGLLEQALYESDDPKGGDYIRYQLGGYTMNYEVEEVFYGYEYKMELMPTYYSTAEQEAYVDEEVAKVLTELDAGALSEEGKIRKVHDYLVDTLSYDSVHKDNQSSHGKTTAYAALKYHQVVCQGYAVLGYRLLKELGVGCRIVSGEAQIGDIAERHAWLSVQIGDRILYLDPTLDDVHSCYDWYMKTAEEFAADHRPEQRKFGE